MDISAVLIGLTLLFLFIGPIAYVLARNGASQKRLAKTFKSLATQKSLTISEVDVIGSTLVGVDDTGGYIAWSYTGQLDEKFQTLPLPLVVQCEIVSEISPKKTIVSVKLRLVTPTGPEEILFYNEEDEDSPSNDALSCLQRAEHWKSVLSEKKKKKAA